MDHEKNQRYYNEKPLILQDSGQCYLKNNHSVPFVESKKGHIVEMLICTWSINRHGQLSKDKQVSFSYKYKYIHSLKLQLSNDKKYIILPVIDQSQDVDDEFIDTRRNKDY